MSGERLATAHVLGVRINAMTWQETLRQLLGWAHSRESRYVAICNVHVVVSAGRDPGFGAAIASADMATPDGAPVAWMLRRLGFGNQARISGPDLMWALCERCASEEIPVCFYGSTPKTLAALHTQLTQAFPDLTIAAMESPPFRALTEAEDLETVCRINTCGAGIVFVGLGCPKQEQWMAAHRGKINAVMLGVGAAFDFHAGTLSRAPAWMRENGLEWLHRLLSEPRRLWKRYFLTNSLFIYGAAKQLLLKTRSGP